MAVSTVDTTGCQGPGVLSNNQVGRSGFADVSQRHDLHLLEIYKGELSLFQAIVVAARAVYDVADVIWHGDGIGTATVTVETWNVLADSFDALDAVDNENKQ